MRLSHRTVLVAFAALLAGSAQAQQQRPPRAEDHLVPDSSILGSTSPTAGYELQVRDILKEAFHTNVDVRMVALPSFFPEYAVGLLTEASYGRGPPYRIFALTPAAQIWTYSSIDMLKSGQVRVVVGDKEKEIAQLEASVPRDPKDLKINRCETEISDALGTRIIALWRKMLLGTRYSAANSMGLDGATYYFGMISPGSGQLAGHIWSPGRESATGNLVSLADTMRDVCNKRPGANMAAIEKITAELEHRLQ